MGTRAPLRGPAAALALVVTFAVTARATPLPAQPAAAPPEQPSPTERSIYGDVVHDETGAPIAGASVILAPAGQGALAPDAAAGAFVSATRTTVTDTAGRYQFERVAPGLYVLRVRRLGFRPATIEIEMRGGESRVSVGLAVVAVRLRPVEVEAESPAPYARHAAAAGAEGSARAVALRQRQRRYLATDVREVTHADVSEAVTLGETDLFRALQRIPGVSAPHEFSAELWTRGGRWDQTRVLFDGLPLYNPVHVSGLLSGVNADAVGAAFLHPGVRPVSLGEGGAAVLDLRSRPGGGDGRLNGVGELSLLSARAALDQRVAGGRGAWMLAARRTFLDLILRRAFPNDKTSQIPYHFSELAGRADWRLGAGRALEISALREEDALTGDVPDVAHGNRARWGNTVARATLAAPLDAGRLGPLHVRQTVGVSLYRGRVRLQAPDSAVADAFSDGPERPVRADITYVALSGEAAPATEGGAPAPWSAGYELASQRAAVAGEARALYVDDELATDTVRRRAALVQLALWAERRLRPTARLTVSPGLRVEGGGRVRGAGVLRPAPRLAARYTLGDSAAFLSAAAGRSFQYTQAVAPVGVLHSRFTRPVPLWLAADDATPALRSDIVTLGAESWVGAAWHASANLYARRSTGVLLPDPTPGPITAHDLFVSGRETARGAEASLRRIEGRWTVAAGYAYGVARAEADGVRFPAPGDRRHALDLTAMARVGRGLRLGAAYTLATGASFTRRTDGRIDFDADRVPFWAEPPRAEAPGAGRLPNYAALDVLVDWSLRIQRARAGMFLQLHNALGRKNAASYNSHDSCWRGDEGAGCRSRDFFDEGLPRVPVLGVRISF